MLTSRGLGTVLGDLAAMGFDAKWGVLGASDVGAPHKRERIWIVGADTRYGESRQQKDLIRSVITESKRQEFGYVCENVADACQIGLRNEKAHCQMEGDFRSGVCGVDRNWWKREPKSTSRTIEPNVGRVVDGLASRVDRLKAIGNGQVPLCAATAWRLLAS
jgi:DNA (cytosine-5)-methyltransferase 1